MSATSKKATFLVEFGTIFGSVLKTQNIPPKNQHNHSKLRIWSKNYTQSTLPGTPKGDPNLSKIVTKSSLSRRGAPTGDF